MNYFTLHKWVATHFERAGRCEDCGREGPTEFASIGHVYTQNRADWREVCRSCHRKMDGCVPPNGRINRTKSACVRGHAFTLDNTYICSRGKRQCRTCNRERSAERRAAA